MTTSYVVHPVTGRALGGQSATANQVVGLNTVATVDTSGGGVTVLAPAAAGVGECFGVEQAGSGDVTVDANGSTIDGAATATVGGDGRVAMFVKDVAEWRRVATPRSFDDDQKAPFYPTLDLVTPAASSMWSFSVNTAPATGPIAIFSIVTLLTSLGWTKTQDSDGTTYSAVGTQVTSGAAGANGLGNNFAWFVLKHPSSSRAFCFQRGNGGNQTWRISYCADNAFTGGAPSATQIAEPAAGSVEIILVGGGTAAAPTFAVYLDADATYRWDVIAGGTAEGYSWTAYARQDGSGWASCPLIFDFMKPGSSNAADTDPYVVGGAVSGQTMSIFVDAEAKSFAWFGALNNPANNLGCGYRRYFTGSGPGVNRFNGADDLVPVDSYRSASPGWKGFSTLFLFPSVDRASGDTYTVDSARDYIYVGTSGGLTPGLVLPWNGTVPTWSGASTNRNGNVYPARFQ